jgi:Protein of unknown function (DUF4038)/Putative collagen-binding domain of a collagenase
VDASGTPFLLQIDTAWSLIADASNEDAEIYLEDRRRKGFNAIIVNLLERKFSRNARSNYSNYYDEPPFLTTDDYSTPNGAYFDHAAYIVRLAASKGILVLLTPSYLGYDGGGEGWFSAMQASANRLRHYGRFLGQRFGGHENILWIHAGDFNPTGNKHLVRDIALGIKEFDKISLHSAHCGLETSAAEFWGSETWLDVNSIYTWTDVGTKARAAYASVPTRPFFLIESGYENEHVPAGHEQRVRVESYQAMLSGAAGQAFGNNPIWHFDGPGVFPDPEPRDWRSWLDSAGARSMVHLRTLFSAHAWWTLVPDVSNALLAPSGSGPFDLAVGATSDDNAIGLVYVPTHRTVTVTLNQLKGPKINAKWFDPAAGTYAEVGTLGALGPKVFSTPGNNSSTTGRFSDWALVLESTL